MNCPYCNAELKNDSKFCDSCGKNLPVDNQDEKLAENKKEVGKNIKDFSQGELKNIKLIAGSIFIVIGFLRILSAGTTISSTSFGGDFYTYTYQGIVAISKLLSSIEVTLGWILVAIGTFIDIEALKK